MFKVEFNLNVVFLPPNMGLIEISRLEAGVNLNAVFCGRLRFNSNIQKPLTLFSLALTHYIIL